MEREGEAGSSSAIARRREEQSTGTEDRYKVSAWPGVLLKASLCSRVGVIKNRFGFICRQAPWLWLRVGSYVLQTPVQLLRSPRPGFNDPTFTESHPQAASHDARPALAETFQRGPGVPAVSSAAGPPVYPQGAQRRPRDDPALAPHPSCQVPNRNESGHAVTCTCLQCSRSGGHMDGVHFLSANPGVCIGPS